MQTPVMRANFHQVLVPNCGTVPVWMSKPKKTLIPWGNLTNTAPRNAPRAWVIMSHGLDGRRHFFARGELELYGKWTVNMVLRCPLQTADDDDIHYSSDGCKYLFDHRIVRNSTTLFVAGGEMDVLSVVCGCNVTGELEETWKNAHAVTY